MHSSHRSENLISAVVTCYNHAGYVEQAIESLLAQTHALFEIIVVDDGSTDDTFERARAFERHNVSVIRTDNNGPSHAMNSAISQSRGDILLFQSGDDISLPHRAERQLNVFQESATEINSGLPLLIGTDGETLSDDILPTFFRPQCLSSPWAFFKSLFFDDNFLCAPCVAIRRSTWDRVGSFHEGLIQLQDYDYWLRAAVRGVNFQVSEERLIKYRVHTNNLSSEVNQRRTAREKAFVLRMIKEDLSNSTILPVLFGESFKQLADTLPKELMISLLYLRHRDPNIQQIGLENLIELSNSRVGAQLLKDHLGIGRSTVFQLLLNI